MKNIIMASMVLMTFFCTMAYAEEPSLEKYLSGFDYQARKAIE